MTETDALALCPFCGGEAELRYHPSCMRDPSHRSWEVGCSICNARVGSTIYATGKTRDEAIAAWNRRAIEATQGRGECHIKDYEDTGYCVCSECGAVLPDDYTVYYCWNCGRKVVDE